jgi:hypothetical protein
VSQAFADPTSPPQGPIRLALAERDRLSANRAIDATPTASIRANEPAPAEAPEPPRRPPSVAFTSADAQKEAHSEPLPEIAASAPLIPGGQPILASGAFVLPLAGGVAH